MSHKIQFNAPGSRSAPDRSLRWFYLVGVLTVLQVAVGSDATGSKENEEKGGGQTSLSIIRGDAVFGDDLTVQGYLDIGYEIVTNRADGGVEVSCPAGKVVLSGGCAMGNPFDDLYSHHPVGNTGWACYVAGDANMLAYAICARVR